MLIEKDLPKIHYSFLPYYYLIRGMDRNEYKGIKGMGLINLFRYFRINGFVSNKNVAYKRYIDQELFAVRQIKKLSINGKTMYRLQTFMTHKGIDYFRDRLISEGYKPNEIDFNGVAEYMETEDLTYEQMMECLAA